MCRYMHMQPNSGRRGLSRKDNRYQEVPLSEHCVIHRKIMVAPGVYAPGHLGELTQLIPFEMVDEALSATTDDPVPATPPAVSGGGLPVVGRRPV